MTEDRDGPSVPSSPATGHEATPRLMITKMELENFKSYAGVQEIGHFHKCFSSVVGPNGSGKSNVIDAMLFVFGKRAKKLRLNKVSELIHKSAAVKDNPPTFARVSVFMQEIIDTGDGDDDFIVVPDSQVVLTRIARNDNSSSYQLNGKNCQFKQVAAYLGQKGIDLDNNRFLILQGEVEMISMMPPRGKNEGEEGLLEYLEDIIGSNKFVDETAKAATELEQLSDVRQEKLNLVKAVEKEKDALLSAKQEAEALLSAEREIRRKKNILYQMHALAAERERERFEKKKKSVDEKVEAERERLRQADDRVRQIEEGFSTQKKEYDAIHKELVKTKEEFSSYERRDIKLREELKHAKAQKKKLETKIKSELKKMEDSIKKGEDAEASIPQLEERIAKLIKQKDNEDAKLEHIHEEVKGMTQRLRTELEEKTQELAPVKQERAVFQAALDTAETEVRLLEDATTRAKEKLVDVEKELASLDNSKTTKQEQLNNCKRELAKAKSRIIEAESEEKTIAEKEDKLASRSKELLVLAEEAKTALQARGSARSSAVTGVLKAARKGGELAQVGVLGRLGDLATIPEKYDIAVSTACGMLDHIVVQTTAGAQKCLEYLRKHELGRANFIPLDKLQKGAHDRSVETPEGAPRLFELISPTNFAITPAIYLAVGNTLVAPDLETATRWAYDFKKRWRVVSLDGKLIETAGTMSGGGKSVQRGGMKLSNGRASIASNSEDESESLDCKQLEQEAKKAQDLLQQCRLRRKELREEIRALSKKVKELELCLPKLSVEIEGFDTSKLELTRLIPELRKQSEMSKDDSKKLKDLQAKVGKCKQDMASCAHQASVLEAEVSRLQKAILDAGGPKLKKQEAVCDKIIGELNAVEKALNTAKVDIVSSQKAAVKAQEAKEATELQLVECKSSIEEKQAQFKALEEDAFKVMQAFEEVKELEAEKRTLLDSVSKECDALRKSQTEIKCAEVEFLAQIETLQKQIAEAFGKKKHWETEVQKLKDAAEEDDDYDVEDDQEGLDEQRSTADPMEDGETDQPASEALLNSSARTEQASRSSLPTMPSDVLDKYDKDEIKDQISLLETERNSLAKNANMGAIAEYRKREAAYLSRVAELDAVTEERNIVRKRYEDLRRQRLEMFMAGFGQITLKLKEMYQMITLGGDAELELVDSLDPFSEGIVFSVRPPKKSWKNISNLSGGEKTLSSLALVFALHHYKPTPLYVMDEIDAALDFKNVSIVANYIKERTKNAQFIIISLRNNMFELADRLVGIFKTNNCTKSVTINPHFFGVDGQQNGFVPTTPALLDRATNRQPTSAMKSVARRVSFAAFAKSQN